MSDYLTARLLEASRWFDSIDQLLAVIDWPDAAQRDYFSVPRTEVQDSIVEAADRIDADARTIADLTAERDRLRDANRMKVALCEGMIRLNGDDPIVPPTAIDWIGNALVAAVLADPEPSAMDRIMEHNRRGKAEMDAAALKPPCATCGGRGEFIIDHNGPGTDGTLPFEHVPCPDCTEKEPTDD